MASAPSEETLVRIEHLPLAQRVVGLAFLCVPPLLVLLLSPEDPLLLPAGAFGLVGLLLALGAEHITWEFDVAAGTFSERRAGPLSLRARTLPLRALSCASSEDAEGASRLVLHLCSGSALSQAPTRGGGAAALHRRQARQINMLLAHAGCGDPPALVRRVRASELVEEALAQRGDAAAARALLQQALRLDPECRAARELSARLGEPAADALERRSSAGR